MLDSLYLLVQAQMRRIRDTLTTLSNSIATLTSNISTLTTTKLDKSGGTVTGELKLTGDKQINLNDYGSMSAGANGNVLIGQNCYIEKSTGKFKYLSTHASMGARGVLWKWDSATNSAQPWFFETGLIATTADAEFTPTLKKMWHEGNLQADTFATTFAKKAGDTYTGTHTHTGIVDVSGGRLRIPVGENLW